MLVVTMLAHAFITFSASPHCPWAAVLIEPPSHAAIHAGREKLSRLRVGELGHCSRPAREWEFPRRKGSAGAEETHLRHHHRDGPEPRRRRLSVQEGNVELQCAGPGLVHDLVL